MDILNDIFLENFLYNNFLQNLSTVSPKNIYYDKESYGKFNILIFDDVILSDENIGLLKVLTDNNKPVKELKTVIDKKAVNFTLEGKFLVIITYAKDNPDEELLNRLYKLNMIIDTDSESEIKKKSETITLLMQDIMKSFPNPDKLSKPRSNI